MPIITPGNASSILSGVFATYQTRWGNAYQATPTWWDKIADEEASGGEQGIYEWMAQVPKLREWVGERQFNSLAAYGYSLTNKNFESSLRIDRNKIEDDLYGVYNKRVDFLGMAAKKWPDYGIRDAMVNGQSTIIYDGQNFFDAAHPVNKFNPSVKAYDGTTTQANYFTSVPLTPANYADKRAAMQKWVGENGETLGIVPNVLAVPPSLEPMGRAILHSDIIAAQTFPTGVTNVGGYTNTLKGSAELVVIPELESEGGVYWYLLCTNWPVKPFIFQQRKAPEFVPLVSPTDPNVFRHRMYEMGVDARGAFGYSLWWLAMKCKTTA
jgi:phage major head subunit gpT-like protein